MGLAEAISASAGPGASLHFGRPLSTRTFSSEGSGFALSFDREGHPVGLFLEAALADLALRRAFQRPAKSVFFSTVESPAPRVASALGAVLVHALRRESASSATLLGARTALGREEIAPFLASAFGDRAALSLAEGLVLPFRVRASEETFGGAIFFPLALLEAAREVPRSLSPLGAMRLRLEVVRERVALTAEELADLGPGDVLLLGKASDVPRRVTLSSAIGERVVHGELGQMGEIVLRFRTMNEERNETLEATLREAPVVVRVEIGAVELPASEWATLGEGDIVSMTQPIGSPVTLRVGSAIVAEGELVDVDGSIGVRILRRG